MLDTALPPKHGFMGRRRWTEVRWRCSGQSKRNLKNHSWLDPWKHRLWEEWKAGSKGSIHKQLRINGSQGSRDISIHWRDEALLEELPWGPRGKEPWWLCGETGAALWKGRFAVCHLMGNCNWWLRKVVLFLWLIKKYKYSFAVFPSSAQEETPIIFLKCICTKMCYFLSPGCKIKVEPSCQSLSSC